MDWQPLSRRESGAGPDGPFEGLPEHLHASVVYWFQGLAGYRNSGGMDDQRLRMLAAALRIPSEVNLSPVELMHGLINWACVDGGRFLDLIDGTLHVWGKTTNNASTQSSALAVGGSAWAVAPSKESLTRVVNDGAQATFDSAASVQDDASSELREAWTNAFGMHGDPSDAWDHAIKAVEATLIPTVVPQQSKPNLGHVIGTLSSQGHLWRLCLPGHDDDADVAPLVMMLRLLWPNPDRHGGGVAKRAPTVSEARAVVTLAATIVQWHREGWVVSRR